MNKTFLLFLLLLTLTGTTCKDSNPVDGNCTNCPTKPDTTSHNFIWKLDTLGAEGSVVNDVAVISEKDIWVVGKFYRVPFGGNDTVAYNAMHWDGIKWELKTIIINNFGGYSSATPLTTIRAFDSTDIWVFSDAGSYGRYNGTSWQSAWVAERQGGITRIWGESSNKLYFGGTNGSLTYWNGSTFTKLETGTTKNVIDMWGCGDSMLVSFQDELKIVGGITIKNYPQSGLSGSIYSIWHDCKEQTMYCITAVSGVMKKENGGSLWLPNSYAPIDAIRVRGVSPSDIYMSGVDGFIGHYNGSNWKSLRTIIPQPENGSVTWWGLSVKKETGAIIGLGASRSYALRFEHF